MSLRIPKPADHCPASQAALATLLLAGIGFCIVSLVLDLPDSAASASFEPLKVDLNRADSHEIALLPAIGPSRALRIVEHRERNGPFLSLAEVTDVPGIGPKTLASISAHVCLTSPLGKDDPR